VVDEGRKDIFHGDETMKTDEEIIKMWANIKLPKGTTVGA